MAKEKFDPRWLEERDSKTGKKLVYYETEKNMVEKNGRKTLQAIRKERPLREEDLLDWNKFGDKVVIVTKNGMKYIINTKEPRESKKEDKDKK